MISPEKFMKIAYEISLESYCEKRKVGALIVKDNSIISVGYNGSPSGFSNICELKTFEPRTVINSDSSITTPVSVLKTLPEVLHAESNAILKLARSTSSSEEADIYVTTAPCIECAKLIIQAGIIRVYYADEYKNKDGLELLNRAKILTFKIEL